MHLQQASTLEAPRTNSVHLSESGFQILRVMTTRQSHRRYSILVPVLVPELEFQKHLGIALSNADTIGYTLLQIELKSAIK